MEDMQSFNDVKICDKIDKIKLVNDLSTKLIECCVANFGVYPDNIQDVVLQKAIKQILKDYNTLSIEQIEYSFDRLVLNKIITVSVDDLINPIKKYFNVLKSIKNERFKIQKEIEDNEKAEISLNETRKKALEFYRECIKKKEYAREIVVNGVVVRSIFYAEIVCNNYLSDKFTYEQKIQFKREAEKIKEINDESVHQFKYIGHSVDRITRELAVIEAIKLNILL